MSLLASLQTRLLVSADIEQDEKTVITYTLLEPKNEVVIGTCIDKSHKEKDFLNLEQFKSLEQFSMELEMYAKNNKKISQPRKRTHNQSSKVVNKPAACYVTAKCICTVLQKSLNDSKFWSPIGLKSLIRNKYICLRSQETMLDCILKYKAFDVLETLTECCTSVSENHLVKTLKLILNDLDPKNLLSLNDELIYDRCPIDETTAKNILYIMAVPHNQLAMKEYFKLLSTNEALVLLQLFHFVLHVVSPALISNSESKLDVPAYIDEKKVLNWIDYVLTAHMIAFTSSNVLTELISQLKTTTARQRQFYRDIAVLAPYLDCFRAKKVNLPKKSIGNYAVETITL